MSKILITRHVGDHAMNILKSSGLELIVNPEDAAPSRQWVLKHLADPDVGAACIMHSQPSDKVDEEFVNTCNANLKCVSTFSVGYDHINVKAAHARGIKIGHTPGVLNDAVADITVMLVLMTLRKVGYGIDLIKRGDWPSLPWAPFVLCGHAISHPGLTIGFLGFGRIPQATVERLLAFTNKTEPANIIYNSSRRRDNQDQIDADFSQKYGIQVRRVEKDQLASQADILIVLCDLNPSTKDLVNKDFLAKMKPSSILVNVARGPVVNSEDLYDALKAGQIFGAGLDVITGEPNIKPDHPLLHLDNCELQS
uniref:Glyoxylate reductase n=1 Tax=Kwoniella dejecticola CBS 10117 TaxID=1296121 RepID=A0A1A6AGL6_9TREE|nr:glyoxylate reductase [Kwoniella dejecticola CBS 10117]OBR89201.1 glyoxylate reductase [Kwoniella dejecticola CBS 10117]